MLSLICATIAAGVLVYSAMSGDVLWASVQASALVLNLGFFAMWVVGKDD